MKKNKFLLIAAVIIAAALIYNSPYTAPSELVFDAAEHAMEETHVTAERTIKDVSDNFEMRYN